MVTAGNVVVLYDVEEGRDTAMSARQTQNKVGGAWLTRRMTWNEVLLCIEGTHDAVGTDWMSGTVPTEAIGTFGWCKIGSVRYADGLG